MANILPPFTQETAFAKVKAAQALWNTRDPSLVTPAYTPDSIWRNRSTFLRGHAEIHAFLTKKWERENGYRLRKELFSFTDNRIAVQFWYEFYLVEGQEGVGAAVVGGGGDSAGKKQGEKQGKKQWYRCYGLEDWTFEENGKMRKRMMSGNDVEIAEEERWYKEGVEVDSVDIGEKHW